VPVGGALRCRFGVCATAPGRGACATAACSDRSASVAI
jgi:hypothetical protein